MPRKDTNNEYDQKIDGDIYCPFCWVIMSRGDECKSQSEADACGLSNPPKPIEDDER